MDGFLGFLSDFGLADEWVASCKGVIYRIAPGCKIIDISHEIPPFSVRKGALVLAATLPYCPVGVYMAVVDPGVGGPRKPLALRVGRGDILIGPDSGLLMPAVERLGGMTLAVEITNHRYMLDEISPLFHGRDIFAPVTAHLLNGVDIKDIGPPLDPVVLAGAPWPRPVIAHSRITCRVIDIDRFGTLRLNIDVSIVKGLPLSIGQSLVIEISGRTYTVPFVRTFSDVPQGELLAAVDSSGWLSISQNLGAAAKLFNVAIDDEVIIHV